MFRIGVIIRETCFFSSTYHCAVRTGKYVAGSTEQILKAALRRQQYQLAFDRRQVGVAPDGVRTRTGAIDNDVLCKVANVSFGEEFSLHELHAVLLELSLQFGQKYRRFDQQG